LAEIDVLIDGPYVAALNDGRGLRGSSNQRIHFLTDRLRSCNYDFSDRPRQAEVRLRVNETVLVGVPPLGLVTTIAQVEQQARGTARKSDRDADGTIQKGETG